MVNQPKAIWFWKAENKSTLSKVCLSREAIYLFDAYPGSFMFFFFSGYGPHLCGSLPSGRMGLLWRVQQTRGANAFCCFSADPVHPRSLARAFKSKLWQKYAGLTGGWVDTADCFSVYLIGKVSLQVEVQELVLVPSSSLLPSPCLPLPNHTNFSLKLAIVSIDVWEYWMCILSGCLFKYNCRPFLCQRPRDLCISLDETLAFSDSV